MSKQYWPFVRARAYVRKLGFKKSAEWHEYKESGNMPGTIPASPDHVYRGKGWVGIHDWLWDTKGLFKGRYRPFVEARKFARQLKFKKSQDWHDYVLTGEKPHDIPGNPRRVYADHGWAGYLDWIGPEDPLANKKEQDLTLGEKIIVVRKSKHLTRQDLAKKIGMSPSKLGERENGTIAMPIKWLVKIADALDHPIDSFLSKWLEEALGKHEVNMRVTVNCVKKRAKK